MLTVSDHIKPIGPRGRKRCLCSKGAQVDGSSPPPGAAPSKRPEGCWAQWKRLLGLDTFVATALHGSNAAQVQARQRSNPFTRGCLTNCKDFWCDSAPMFGERENGSAMLNGQTVNYTDMYEAPMTMPFAGTGQRSGSGGRSYEAVAFEEV